VRGALASRASSITMRPTEFGPRFSIDTRSVRARTASKNARSSGHPAWAS
jgi:hypothetical protein